LNQYLLVGSAGFIGKTLSKTLIREGLPVVLIDSQTQLKKLMSGAGKFDQFDRVVWAASKVNPVSAEINPGLCEAELKIFQEFLAALKSNGNQNVHFIFLSSAGCLYDGQESAFDETCSAQGTNAYGKLKRQMELALEKSGLPYSILRISNVYGPNQPIGRGQGVIAEWIDAITHGREICVFGQLDSTRDYIYIDDVTDAILALSEGSLSGIYNVGSGTSHSLRDVITILTDLAKEELRVDYRASRPTDRRNFSLEISKILRESSWVPKYSLDLGIKLSLESNTAGK